MQRLLLGRGNWGILVGLKLHVFFHTVVYRTKLTCVQIRNVCQNKYDSPASEMSDWPSRPKQQHNLRLATIWHHSNADPPMTLTSLFLSVLYPTRCKLIPKAIPGICSACQVIKFAGCQKGQKAVQSAVVTEESIHGRLLGFINCMSRLNTYQASKYCLFVWTSSKLRSFRSLITKLIWTMLIETKSRRMLEI